MRKDILNMYAKLSRKFGFNQQAYYVAKQLLPIRGNDLTDAESYLEKIRTNLHSSCIANNKQCANPRYDVQVVIPVYNAGKWLRECVDSIINQQTRYSYHIIATNDGSLDNSRDILREYEQYPNVTIIDQPNGGISAARNAGLREINARYIMFIDSDDCLMPNAIENLVGKADELNADIVEGNYLFFQDNKVLSVNHENKDSNVYTREMGGVPWGKVYKASIWKNLLFPLGCFYEDMINRMLIYPQQLKQATISDVIYRYRKVGGGFTRGNNRNVKRVDAYWVLKQMLQDAQQLSINHELIYEAFLKQCHFATMRIAMLDDRTANYAVYKALRQLRDTYFKDMHAQGEKEKRIESALLNDDYKEYLLYCLFLY